MRFVFGREWVARIGLLIVGCVFALLAAEVFLRIAHRGDNLRITATADFYQTHPIRDFTLKSNLRTATYWDGKKVVIKTNEAGRRIPDDPEFVEQRGRAQIVFLGDSYVFGNEENAADIFVNVVRTKSEFDTINLGVAGYNTYQENDILKEYAANDSADPIEWVLLFFFLGNDFQGNALPPGHLSVDDQGRLLKRGKRQSLLLRRLIYRSDALSFVFIRAKVAYHALKYRSAEKMYSELYTAAFYTDDLLSKTRDALIDLRDFSASIGKNVAVILVPEKDQLYKEFRTEEDRVRPNAALTGLLTEIGVDYLDLLPYLRERQSELPYNMIPVGHFSPRGHEIVADLVLDFIRER